MANLHLKRAMLEAVDNQLKQDEPKEAGLTFVRLIKNGYSEQAAKEKIAAVLLEEIYDVMKESKPYNEERYVSKLKNLK